MPLMPSEARQPLTKAEGATAQPPPVVPETWECPPRQACPRAVGADWVDCTQAIPKLKALLQREDFLKKTPGLLASDPLT